MTGTALITGASRGIGLGYAQHYLDRGWCVVATTIEPENADTLTALQATHGDRLFVQQLEVKQEPSIAALTDRLEELDLQLDLVINNAGVSIEKAFEDWNAANFLEQFHTNAIGPALVARAVAPRMNRGAKLVNVTSGMGSLTLNLGPTGPLAAYAASKAALNQLTRRLAGLLQPRGVAVFAINPGWVRTEMGGPEAPTSIEDAVATITATIESLTPDQSGGLFEGDGSQLPF